MAEASSSGAWDLSEAVVIRCGPTSQFGVKSITIVPSALTLWAAYKNRIIIVDATSFQRLHVFVSVPLFSIYLSVKHFYSFDLSF